jgi:hypothetical protein
LVTSFVSSDMALAVSIMIDHSTLKW